jgi:O-antigen/teichoic acid export membrane protein
VAFFASAGFYLFGGNWLTVERPLSVAALVAAATAALALYNLTAASLRGVREMRVSSFLGGQQQGGPLGNLLFLVFAAAVWLLHGLSLATTLAAYTAAYTLALGLGIAALRKVVQRIYVPNTSSGPPALLSAARLLSTCVPMLVAQLLSFASRQADLWIAGATVSPVELALYVGATRAVQLVAVPLSLVNLSVMSLIPELRSQKRLAELERMLQTSATLAALPATAALGLFIVLPGLMLSIFLGPYYRGAAIPLVCLSVGQFVFTWTGAKELALLLSGHEKVVAAINALAAAALLGAGYIVCLQNGIVGLAIVAAVVISLQNLVQWVLAKKLVGVWTHATLYL